MGSLKLLKWPTEEKALYKIVSFCFHLGNRSQERDKKGGLFLNDGELHGSHVYTSMYDSMQRKKIILLSPPEQHYLYY